MSKRSVLRVAINAPLSRLFDYSPPPAGTAKPGCRVRVPFGRQEQIGLVMEIADTSCIPANKLRAAIDLLDEEPLLGGNDLWLIRFTSSYYHHPIGEVVAAALPAALRQGGTLRSISRKMTITQTGANADVEIIA